MQLYTTNSSHGSQDMGNRNNRQSRGSSSQGLLSAPITASVDSYNFEDRRYWYMVNAAMEDERSWNFCRFHEDFYDFQIAPLDEFKEEAGHTENSKPNSAGLAAMEGEAFLTMEEARNPSSSGPPYAPPGANIGIIVLFFLVIPLSEYGIYCIHKHHCTNRRAERVRYAYGVEVPVPGGGVVMGDIPIVTSAAGVAGTALGGGMSDAIRIMSCPRHGHAAEAAEAAMAATQGKEDTQGKKEDTTTAAAAATITSKKDVSMPTAQQNQGHELAKATEDADKMVEVPLNDDEGNYPTCSAR
ncbi:hypothetical protein FPQ18DRAFT_407935 [Pyronema domesticum]|nr:hypothetical protein FPQ18DRAFT_407935 [Pyronema domesticum]